jgi:hypothetical protein
VDHRPTTSTARSILVTATTTGAAAVVVLAIDAPVYLILFLGALLFVLIDLAAPGSIRQRSSRRLWGALRARPPRGGPG